METLDLTLTHTDVSRMVQGIDPELMRDSPRLRIYIRHLGTGTSYTWDRAKLQELNIRDLYSLYREASQHETRRRLEPDNYATFMNVFSR